MEERLQKLMAQAGIASRRESEDIIAHGRVTVNGLVASVGDKADPATDDIRVDGQQLSIEAERMYIMLYKPMGIVTTVRAQEQERRRTVRDLISVRGRLYPVGRLDADSEGLIILTNDGELAQKLTHPRYEHPKVYDVALRGSLNEEALNIWRRGIVLDDGPTQPAEVRVLSRDSEVTRLRVTMREGRKRQIRRIASLLGHPVSRLVRTQFDTLSLGAMQPGEWRYLTESEIESLQKSARSTSRPGKLGPLPRPRRTTTADETEASGSPSASSGKRRRSFAQVAHADGTDNGRPVPRRRAPARRPYPANRSNRTSRNYETRDEGSLNHSTDRPAHGAARPATRTSTRRPAGTASRSGSASRSTSRSSRPGSRPGSGSATRRRPAPSPTGSRRTGGRTSANSRNSRPGSGSAGRRTSRPSGSAGSTGGSDRSGKPSGTSRSRTRRSGQRRDDER